MTFILIPLNDLVFETKIGTLVRSSRTRLTALRASIVDVGLLNPLVVTKQKSKYLVINGRKRLMVLRQLAKSKVYMKSLHKVPCLAVETADQELPKRRRPLLVRAPALAHALITDINSGLSSVSIAQKYECDINLVDDALSFRNLHETVLQHFSNEVISWDQAAALATIPNPDAQMNLLKQLGPFVSDKEIIAAIRAGDTVIELPDGNVICLPTRPRQDISLFDQEHFTETTKARLAA